MPSGPVRNIALFRNSSHDSRGLGSDRQLFASLAPGLLTTRGCPLVRGLPASRGPIPRNQPMSPTNVLIVDDDDVLGQVLTRVLTQQGYKVDRAIDAAQALQLAE